jgi:hypothetical protein
MSDSPLDGGSGWPTSAYQIVPRTSSAAPPPPVAGPEPAPAAPEPEDEFVPSRKGRIAALAIGLVVLIIAVVGGVLATRDYRARSDADATAVTTPSANAAATGVPAAPADDPSASAGGVAGGSGAGGAGASLPAGAEAGPSGSAAASASAGASGGPSTPAGPPATGILRAGTAKLAVVAGQPDDAFDFDSGLKQTAGADATAGVLGISAANGARFAVLITSDTPSLAACSAVPAGQWVSQVLLAALLPGTKVCIHTSDDRYAWFMTRAGEAVNGAVFTANLDYIVYKRPGD